MDRADERAISEVLLEGMAASEQDSECERGKMQYGQGEHGKEVQMRPQEHHKSLTAGEEHEGCDPEPGAAEFP